MRTILFALILAAPVVAQEPTEEQARANAEAKREYEAEKKAIEKKFQAVRDKHKYAFEVVLASFEARHYSALATFDYLSKLRPRTSVIEKGMATLESDMEKCLEEWDKYIASLREDGKASTPPPPTIIFTPPPEENRQRRREQPRQVICYSETLPGPNGGTVQTRCY